MRALSLPTIIKTEIIRCNCDLGQPVSEVLPLDQFWFHLNYNDYLRSYLYGEE